MIYPLVQELADDDIPVAVTMGPAMRAYGRGTGAWLHEARLLCVAQTGAESP